MDKFFFLLYISYNGSCFNGLNKQLNTSNTIIETLETKLKNIFSNFKLKFFSRTDKFVHALEQKILLTTEKDFNHLLIKKILNNSLKYISVDKVKKIERELYFKDIKYRTYIYKFKKKLTPFDYFYFTEYKRINLNFLEENLKLFIGKYDFKYFSKTKIDTTKTIYILKLIIINKNEFHILIKGSGFTRHMIRRILSTVLSIKTKKEQSILKECLTKTKNIYNTFTINKISPNGLYLKKIEFNECRI